MKFNLKNIAIGFTNRALQAAGQLDGETEAMARRRLLICGACPEKENFLSTAKCNLCGCILSAKTLVKDEACPINKW